MNARDTQIIGCQFTGDASPAIGVRDTRRTLGLQGQAGGAGLKDRPARVLSAKMILRVDSSLISLWRVDLEGNANATAEPPEATPIFAGSFTPPDTFESSIFITGYSLPTIFQWDTVPAGQAQTMEFQPMLGRDASRIVSCNSALRFRLQEFGPGPSVGFTAWVWLRVQWEES